MDPNEFNGVGYKSPSGGAENQTLITKHVVMGSCFGMRLLMGIACILAVSGAANGADFVAVTGQTFSPMSQILLNIGDSDVKCRERCRANSRCTGYTWQQGGSSSDRCEIFILGEKTAGGVSGTYKRELANKFKKFEDHTVDHNKWLEPEVRTMVGGSDGQCETECKPHSDCFAFHFKEDKCNLYIFPRTPTTGEHVKVNLYVRVLQRAMDALTCSVNDCIECQGAKCQDCDGDLEGNADGDECKMRCHVENCRECHPDNSHKCSNCYAGYNKAPDGSHCKEQCHVHNCLECEDNNPHACKSCAEGYIPDQMGRCERECQVTNCMKCITGNPHHCETCRMDFDPTSAGTCIKDCNVARCLECAKSDKFKCLRCLHGVDVIENGRKCAVISNMPQSVKDDIVTAINDIRRNVQPAAKSMMQTSWDDALATAATQYAKSCRSTPQGSDERKDAVGLGLSIGEVKGEYTRDESWVKKVIPNWSKNKGDQKYLQMVHDCSSHVGCGTAICDDEAEGERHVYVCYFLYEAPPNRATYITAVVPCQGCKDTCENKLCACNTGGTAPICRNGGVLNPDKCLCNCQSTLMYYYGGHTCQTKYCKGDAGVCERDSKYNNKALCKDKDVQDNCPMMCGLCIRN